MTAVPTTLHILMTTQLMLFVVILDTPVIPAGQVDQNGGFSTTTTLKFATFDVVTETGVLVLSQHVTYTTVITVKISFLLVLVS